jgi:hypothetical protein
VKKECHDLKEETLKALHIAKRVTLLKCPEHALSMPKSKEANKHGS